MFSWSRTKSCGMLLVGVLFIASCGGGGSTSTAGGTVPSDATPTQGGTLRLLEGTEYPSLDPVRSMASASTSPLNALYAIFSALVYSEAPSGEVQMGLAESLTTPDAGRTWVLKLRDGLQFSDGEPLDAAAVKFNWDRIKDPANRSPSLSRMEAFESYDVIDPTTLEIVLTTPDSQFPRSVAGPFAHIGSPAAIVAAGEDFGAKPVGAGPFTVQEWARNDHLTLVRNGGYWDTPRPYVDEVVFRWNQDESGQALRSFKANEADLMFVRSDIQVAASAEKSGANVLRIPGAAGSGLLMNQSIPALGDQRVREAFALTIDRDELATVVYGKESGPNGLFAEESIFHDPANDYPAPDLDKAQQLIDAYIAESGEEINLVYTTSAGYATQQKLGQVMQQQLQQLKGVKIEIVPVETAVLIQQNRDGLTQMGTLAIQGVWPDPALYDQFHSDGLQNTPSYSNPVVDAAFLEAHTVASVDEQADAYKRVAREILADAAYVPLNASVYGLVSQPNVQGVAGFGDSGLQIDKVWLNN